MGITNIKGDIAELTVAKTFLELGYRVSFPFGDDAPYDLVTEKESVFTTVQIKYSKLRRDRIHIPFVSNTGIRYSGLVDYVAALCPETDKIYLIKMKDYPTLITGITLRLTSTKNNQKKRVNMAVDFEIQSVL